MRTLHGSRVGRKAKAGWVCDQCAFVHDRKPALSCGGACLCTTFEYFKSRAEMKRWGELRLLLSMGQIRVLRREVRYDLHAAREDGGLAQRIGFYKADFVYTDVQTEQDIIEDVKGGADTHMSKWKRRHTEAQYGITINIIQR